MRTDSALDALFSGLSSGNGPGMINAPHKGNRLFGTASTAADRKRRHTMNALGKKIENLFLAVTFAEAGEFETAREYMREEERPRQSDRVVPTMRPRKELKAPGLKRR